MAFDVCPLPTLQDGRVALTTRLSMLADDPPDLVHDRGGQPPASHSRWRWWRKLRTRAETAAGVAQGPPRDCVVVPRHVCARRASDRWACELGCWRFVLS